MVVRNFLEYFYKLVVFTDLNSACRVGFLSIGGRQGETGGAFVSQALLLVRVAVLICEREQLVHDAADGIHVHFLRVILIAEYDLGCSIPPGADMDSFGPTLFIWSLDGPGKTEIADEDITVLIDENILGLKVSMNHRGRMKEIYRAKQIV